MIKVTPECKQEYDRVLERKNCLNKRIIKKRFWYKMCCYTSTCNWKWELSGFCDLYYLLC